jgi:hypothetical protein
LRLYFWIISSGSGIATFSCIQIVERGANIIVFNVHHHHGGVLGGERAVD